MKVMFICTGNICRSAMAEGMLKKIVKEKSIDVNVFSCGIYAQTGDYATYNAIEAMKQYDVKISKHRATNIKDSKIEEMDVILCATMQHKQSIIYMYPELENKVYTMKEYAGIDKDGQDMNIKDPWGYDLDTYKNCAKEIYNCVQKIIEKCKNK